MIDPLAWIDVEALDRSKRGLTRRLKTLGASTPGRIVIDGRELINFSSNDYLGLASDPRTIAAAIQEAKAGGWGSGASPLVTGWREAHQKLAIALARFEKTEAAALFPTGFAANLGTIASLVGPQDAVYLDRLNHACLVAGAKLSGAKIRVYRHRDNVRLQELLLRERTRYRRVLIATDGVFSMDGDLAPISELADLAERFEAMLLVDEAHGTGVFGADGRGACSELHVTERIPIRVGTLSKSLGSLGGFVAGSQRLIDHLVQNAPSFIYSTSLPAPAAAAALESLRIVEAEPWRRERVRALGDHVRSALSSAGFNIGDSIGPIIPVLIGDPQRALELAELLRNDGLFVSAIRPPTVPRGTDRLRISLSAVHSDSDAARLVERLLFHCLPERRK